MPGRFLPALCILSLLIGMSLPVRADVVAARTLRVGTVIAKTDLEVLSEASEKSRDRMIGRETKRAIYAGRKIEADNLGPVTIVHRNDVIRLVYSSKGLGLRTEGRALGDGGVGEVIPVMNLDTRIVIQATILGPNRAGVSR